MAHARQADLAIRDLLAILFKHGIRKAHKSRARHRSQHLFERVTAHRLARKQLAVQFTFLFPVARAQCCDHTEEHGAFDRGSSPEPLRDTTRRSAEIATPARRFSISEIAGMTNKRGHS